MEMAVKALGDAIDVPHGENGGPDPYSRAFVGTFRGPLFLGPPSL